MNKNGIERDWQGKKKKKEQDFFTFENQHN
jgi:hypothetical protein